MAKQGGGGGRRFSSEPQGEGGGTVVKQKGREVGGGREDTYPEVLKLHLLFHVVLLILQLHQLFIISPAHRQQLF